MADENLVVWTSDWHLLESDGSTSPDSPGYTTPTEAQAAVAHIVSLDPLGCVDTGDDKNNYLGHVGIDTELEAEQFDTIVGGGLPWLTVNPGDTNALYPTLPGNHDEDYDSAVTGTGNDNFPIFDAQNWPAPYHWTCDWPSARIRFIGYHVYIHHTGTGSPVDASGFFHIPDDEYDWLENELGSLPPGWKAITCCHAPVAYTFGGYVRYKGTAYDYGLNTALSTLLSGYADDIVCQIGGHRHSSWGLTTQQGVTHITASGVAYNVGNARGVFAKLEHDPAERTLTFDMRYATSPYERYSGYTPVVLDLPAFRTARAKSGLTPATSSAARLKVGA